MVSKKKNHKLKVARTEVADKHTLIRSKTGGSLLKKQKPGNKPQVMNDKYDVENFYFKFGGKKPVSYQLISGKIANIQLNHKPMTTYDFSKKGAYFCKDITLDIGVGNNKPPVRRKALMFDKLYTGTVLILPSNDFRKIKNEIAHKGAFGSDYKYESDGVIELAFVWKFPWELTKLYDFPLDSILPVGKYPIKIDGISLQLMEQYFSNPKENPGTIMATKMKIKMKNNWLHELVIYSSGAASPPSVVQKLAMISSSYFLNDFDNPQDHEIQNIVALQYELILHNIIIYSCSEHHAIIFYYNKENQQFITPHALSNLLLFNNSPSVIYQIIRAHCIEHKYPELFNWYLNYTTYF